MVADVEWYEGELFPQIDCIVTNLKKRPKNVVKFHNGYGIAEYWIEEGTNTIKWTKSVRCTFKDNQMRL